MTRSQTAAEPHGPWPITLAVGMSLVVLAAIYLDQQEADLLAVASVELVALAEAKAERIAGWRAERLSDGRSNSAQPLIARLVRQVETHRASDLDRADLVAWARSWTQHQEYLGVALFGARGDLLVAEGIEWSRSLEVEAAEAMRIGSPWLSAPHRDGDGASHVDLFVPLHVADGGGAKVAGLALLRVDPREVLVPLVLGSRASHLDTETTLVDLCDGAVLGLEEDRAGDGPRRSPPDPMEAAEPSALEATQASEIVDGSGAPVLAAFRPVPESSWALRITVPRGAVLAPMRERALRAALLVTFVVALLAAGSALWWRRRRGEFRQRQAEAERARELLERHMDALSKHAPDAILLTDDGCWIVQANDRVVDLYGISRPELLGRSIRDLLDPGMAGDQELRRLQVNLEGAARFESRHRRLDGTTFPVDVISHSIELDGRRYHQSIIRDATARQQAEEALRASEARFRAAFFDAAVGAAMVDGTGASSTSTRPWPGCSVAAPRSSGGSGSAS